MTNTLREMERDLAQRFRAQWVAGRRRWLWIFGLFAAQWILMLIVAAVVVSRGGVNPKAATAALALCAFNAGVLTRRFIKTLKDRFPEL